MDDTLRSGESKRGYTRRPILLVIDDDAQISRLMERMLRSSFNRVFATMDPTEADRILRTQKVTHLLCDFHLGVGDGPAEVTGFAFVELWRQVFPDIERAVIFTGSDIRHLKRPAAVDAVVSKTDGIQAVIDTLLGR